MKKNIYIFAVLTLFITGICSHAGAQQTITMTQGTQTVDLCQTGGTGIIYDNGGPSGQYSNSFDGTVVLQAAQGVSIMLTGSYNTENCCDHIYVYDGASTSGTLLGQFQNTGTVNVTATSGAMTIRFTTDASVTRDGFALTYTVSGMGTSCNNPLTNLTCTGVTAYAANLSWSAAQAGSKMVKVSSALGTSRYFTTGNGHSLTGLHPNTQYAVSVCDVLDSTSPCCMAHTSFVTNCGASPLPIEESFESCGTGNAEAFPRCWSRVKNYDNSSYPYVETYSSNRVMRMYCGNLDYHFSMLMLPEAQVSSFDGVYLRFSAYPESSNAKLIIGVSDDTTLMGHGFTPVDTISFSNYNSWIDCIVPLDGYAGQGRFVTIRFDRATQSSNGSYMRIDNVVLATCGIQSVSASHLTYNSVRLTFNTFGSPNIDLEYGPQGFEPGTGTTVANVSSPYTVEGLQPTTAYTFRLVPTCVDGLFLQGQRSVNATTLAQRDAVAPLCEDFATNTIGTLWLRRGGNSYWETTNDVDHYHLAYGSYTTGYNSTAYLVSPRFADSLHTLSVSFWARDWYNYNSRTIQIATTRYPEQESEYHYVGSVTVNGNVWRRYQISLADAPAGDEYVVIRTNASSTYHIIDEIAIAPCQPRDVRLYGVTDHEATISWQGAESVRVQWGDNTVVATGSPFTFGGLPADSTLTLWVQGTCDGAGCPEPFTVTTLAAPLTAPYCETFESTISGQLPMGWVAPFRYEGYPQVRNTDAYDGTHSVQLYSRAYYGNAGYAPRTYLVMPILGENDFSQLYLNYQAKVLDWSNSSDAGMLDIGMMTDPYDTSTFVTIASHGFGSYNTYAPHHIDLSSYTGTGRYIAFRYRFDPTLYRYARVCIDNLKLSHGYVESASSSMNTTDTSVTLNWHTVPSGQAVTLHWGTDTVTVAGDSTYTATGLTPGTNYTFELSTGDCYFSDLRISQRTLDSMLVMPYCEDFQRYSDNQNPRYWHRVTTHNEYPRIWTASDGKRYLDMCANRVGGNCTYALPIFGESLQNMTLQFSLYHYQNTLFIVGVMDNPSDMGTFVPVDTLDFTGRNFQQWYTYTVPLSGYTGTGRHIAFRHESYTTSNYCNWMRDLRIFTCALTNPRVYNITNNSATVSWSGYPSEIEGDVWVEYGPRNFTVGDSAAVRVLATSNPFNITGLEENTDYDFVFISPCGGGNCPYPRVQIRTMSFASQPTLCYGFETESTNSLPEGWTRPVMYSSQPRVLNENGYAQYSYQSRGFMEFQAYNCSGNKRDNYLVSPLLQVDNMSGLNVSFRYRYDSQYGDNMRFIVGVMTDPTDTNTFVGVDTIIQNRPCCQYYQHYCSLASYTGEGRYLAFKYEARTACRSNYFQMDNLMLSLCRIENVNHYNVTDHSALLSWDYPDGTYSGDGVIIEYDTLPFAYGTGQRVYAPTSPYLLDGLMHDRTYYYYVTPNCTGSNNCATEQRSFTTMAGPLVPPYCTNFDSYGNYQMPFGWYRPQMFDNCPCTYQSTTYTSPTSMHMRCRYTGDNARRTTAALPMMEVDDISQLSISFRNYRETTWDLLEVGVMTNPNDSTTFVPVDTILTPSTYVWTLYNIPLASYGGTGKHIAFRYSSRDNGQHTTYIDEVTVRSCYVDQVQVHHVRQTTAQVSWTEHGSTAGVWVEYAPVGSSTGTFTRGTGTWVFLEHSGDMISGLLPATWYCFYVSAQCGDTRDECNYVPLHAQTLHPPVAFPHCEDFDDVASDAFPSNWRRIGGSDVTVTNDYGHSLRFYSTSGRNTYAIMPEMEHTDTCTSINGMALTFGGRTNGCDYTRVHFIVGVMEDVYDTNSFTPIDTIHGGCNEMETYAVSLASYQGMGAYIAFKFAAINGGYNYWLDNLCVEPCMANEFTVARVEADTVVVEWTSIGNPTVVCEYGPAGYAPGTGTTVTFDSSPGIISGLNGGTAYSFHFSTLCDCGAEGYVNPLPTLGNPGVGGSWGWGWGGGWGGGGGGGGWGGIGTEIVTPPDPCYLPYCDDFDHYDSLNFPFTWHRTYGSNTQYPKISHNRYHSEGECMEFYTVNSATNRYQSFACLPPMGAVDNSQLVMKFWMMSHSNYSRYADAGFYVGVMTNPHDTTSFIPVAQVRINTTGRWEEKVVDFSSYAGPQGYVAFKFAPKNEAYSVYVDDIYMGYCAVSNVQYTNATGTSIDVSWTQHNTPNAVQVTYGEQGFVERGENGTTVTCTTNPFTLTGLSNGESYDFYLSALCGDSNSTCLVAPYTLNPSIVAPHCEDFDGYANDQLPRYWSRRANYADRVRTYNQRLRMYGTSYGSEYSYAYLPPLRGESLSNVVLSFDAYAEGYYSYQRVVVGVIEDTNDRNSFVPLDTITFAGDNVTRRYSSYMSAYSGTADRIALRAYSTYYGHWINIDNLSVTRFATPRNVRVHHITSSKVKLTWDHDSLNTQPYSIEYGLSRFGTGIIVQAEGDSVVLEGLQPDTQYEYFFRAGGYANECQRGSFTTLKLVALPYCEDFEGIPYNGMPDAWTKFGNCDAWYRGVYMPYVNTHLRYSGSNSMEIRFSNSSGQYAYAVMPEFDVDSVRDLNISMMVYCEGYPTRKKLIFGVMEDRNDYFSFVPVDTLTFSSGDDGAWKYRTVSLRNYHGDGRFVAFQYVSDLGYNGFSIDNIIVESFRYPNFSAGPDNDVVVQVPQMGDEVDYYVEYGLRGFSPGHGTTVHVTTNPFYIENLPTYAIYDFYAYDSPGGSTCHPVTSLTIQELPRTPLPYCENFDASARDQVVPSNWSRYPYSSTTGWPGTSTYTYWSSRYSLNLYKNYNYINPIAILPRMDCDTLSRLNVQMRCRVLNNPLTRMLVVGVMSSQRDTNTFVPVDTIRFASDENDKWVTRNVSLYNYRGNGRFIAFKQVSTITGDLFVDNLVVSRSPVPEVDYVDYNTVSFTTLDPTPDYYVEYGPADSLRDSNLIVHVTSSPYLLTNLQPNTLYRFWSTGDSIVNSTCYTYTQMLTSSLYSLPYCENFDSYGTGASSYATGWIRLPYNNNNDYLKVHNYRYQSASRSIESYASGPSVAGSGYAVLPEFSIDDIRNASVSFDWYPNDASVRLVVGVMDNPNDRNSFTPVDTLLHTTYDRWYHHQVSLSSYTGTGRHIAFRNFTTNYSSWTYLDNVMVEARHIPSDVSVYLSAHNEVTVSWNDTLGTDFWVEYDTAGFTQGEGIFVHVGQSPFTIGNLDDLTSYQFYLRCDTLSSTCRQPVSIRTSTLYSLPYCEGFESYSSSCGSFPANWIAHLRENDNCDLRVYSTACTGSRGLYFECYYATDFARNCFAVLPDLDVADIRDVSVEFDVRMYSYTHFVVGVMTNPYDRYTFTPVDTISVADNNVWTHIQSSLASYAGNGRFVAIRYYSNGSSWNSANIDNLHVTSCLSPVNFHANVVAYNQVELSWTGDAEDFFVEYDTAGFAPGTGHFLYRPTNPTLLTLENNTSYDFYVRCDTLHAPCMAPVQATTGIAPLDIPTCIDFEGYATNQLPEGWFNAYDGNDGGSYAQSYVTGSGHSGSRSLYLLKRYGWREYVILPDVDIDSIAKLNVAFWAKSTQRDGYLEVGVLDNANDIASFSMVKRITFNDGNYHHYNVSLGAYTGVGRYICFRVWGTNSSYSYPMNAYIDDIFLSTCGATDFSIQDITDCSATFTWNQTGMPDITLEYGPQGFAAGTGTTLHPTSSPYTVTGLDPLTHYTFRISSDCDDLGANCSADESREFNIFTPVGGTGCVDYTDLTDADVTCTYGSYNNPYANIGIIDNGYEAASSRHTVHYDTTATDPRTGNLLRVVPSGSDASVRLGNWLTNAEAESITYGLLVDTNDFDLLVLKYAAVLQDPAHGPSHQPRFRIQILDSEMNLIDADCGAADFIANQQLGWNVAANNVLWKDWTTVGLDLSPYAGQRVFVRLTTFDCGEATHYGYAYFTLNCMRKSMTAENCGIVAENTFTAPSGFAYRWYSSAAMTDTISTEQSITVPSDNTVIYYCDASFVDNANCYFTLSAFAGTRFPLADFTYSYTVENCHFNVQFQNNSTISADGEHPIGTGEPCESARWDFGNGLTSTAYHGATTYDMAGTYYVTLYSGLAGDACIDSITLPIVLEADIVHPVLSGPGEVCEGDMVTLTVDHALSVERWSHESTAEATVSFVADSSVTIYAFVVDSNGCADTLAHSLNVHRLSHVPDYQNVCENALPYIWQDGNGYSTAQTGVPTVTLTDGIGCDSIVALYLTIHSSTESYVYDTIVQNLLPWNFHSRVLTTDTTDMLVTVGNAAGCDSVIHYYLYVWRNQSATADSVLCQDELPITWNGHTFGHTGATQPYILTHQAHLHTTHGADSLLTMNVHVNVNTQEEVHETVLENDLPYIFNGQSCTASGTYTATLPNASGCDSLVTLHLQVFQNATAEADSTVCFSELPLTWNGHTFTATASSQPQTLRHTVTLHTVEGADSLLTMVVTVNPENDEHFHQTICSNETYTFAGYTYSVQGEYIHQLENQYGCDSVATLHLTVHATTSSLATHTACDSYVWNGQTYTTTGTYTYSATNSVNCDSTATLELTILQSTASDVYDTVVENLLPHSYNGSVFAEAGDYTVVISNAAGCDSTISYHLYVYENTSAVADSVVCYSALPLTWNGHTFTATATSQPQTLLQLVTLTTATGADSLLTMRLTINPEHDEHFPDTICDNQSSSFAGQTYTTAGDYPHQLTNRYGCDSTATLHLTVHATTSSLTTHTACDSYAWNGETYTTTGTYTYSATNSVNCDSTATLELTILQSTASDVYDTVVENLLPHSYNGSVFAEAGDYTVVIPNAAGCDSTISYHLYVYENTSAVADSVVCYSALPLTWNGHTFTATATSQPQTLLQLVTLTTGTGADSLLTMRLTINPEHDEHFPDTICDNQSSAFAGQTYTTAGDYPHQLTNRYGCDSTATLHLTVHATTASLATHTACDSYEWNGQTYTASGSYDHHTLNTHGCDSTATLNLTVNHSTTSTTTHTACDSYEWNGETYTATGAYDYHTQNAVACDSTATLDLTIRYSTSSTVACTACDSYLWNGVQYSSSGTYSRVSPNAAGCDSTATLELTINHSTTSLTTHTACDSYAWNGETYTTTGTYTYSATNAVNCDSTATLELTILQSTASDVYDTVVENLLPHSYNGSVFAEAGDYTVVISNAAGCDSTISYHLYVYENTSAVADSVVCYSALPLTWNGHTFTAQATSQPQTLLQLVTLTTGTGADSLLTMRLTINPEHDEHFPDTICDNQSSAFAGQTYTAAGDYPHQLTNRYGCDSTATLHLTVHATTASLATHTACDSYEWNGQTYTASGSYDHHTLNTHACDSTATLNLTVNHSTTSTTTHTACDSYAWNGATYTATGAYDYHTQNAVACDSTATLDLTIHYANGSLTVDTICDDQTLAFCDTTYSATGTYSHLLANRWGCDSTATLQLTVGLREYYHDYDTTCSNQPYTYHGATYTLEGDYLHTATNRFGCDSNYTLHLTVHPVTYSTQRDTILENQLPYTFNGHLCLDSGMFTVAIPNAMGCDSVISYHLFVHRNVSTTLDSAVCADRMPLTWDDSLFTAGAAGSYLKVKHLHDRHGADSTVTMRLTVHPVYSIPETVAACDSYQWQGRELAAGGFYTDTLLSRHGCDSVRTLTLTVNLSTSSTTEAEACDSYQWEGTAYTQTGTYAATRSNAVGCDSLMTLNLTLHRSDTSEESAISCGPYLWNGQECAGTGTYEHRTQTAHGCDSLCLLHLRVPTIESERSEAHCDSLRWNTELYTASGTYTQQFQSVDGCDSVATLQLTIHRSSENREQVTLCEGDLPYQYNGITYPYGTQRGEQRIVYTDLSGCDSVILLQLDIYYNPVQSVSMLQYLCREHEFELQAALTPEAGPVTWSSAPYDPTTIGREHDSRLLVSPHQPTVYTAQAEVPGTDCRNSLTVTVGPIVDLEAGLSVTPEFATPQQSELTLRDQSRGTVRAWQWQADGDEVCDRPVCQWSYPLEKDSVEVTLIVTEPRYNCRDTARTVVRLLGGDLFAPNAFTPDESTNQRFVVRGKNIVDFEISIYARNGQRVYYSVDMDEGWDGRNLSGQPCPVGAYVYLIRYTTTEAPRNPETRRGSVLLLR